MKIELHIERLVLEGLPIERQHAGLVQEAVQIELTRLLTQRGLHEELTAGGARPRVAADAIEVTPGATSPVQLGDRIASSVHAGLSQAQTQTRTRA